MKRLLLALALCVAVPLVPVGCNSQQQTLEAGGAYTDPILAKTDRAILDASHAMTAFIDWANINSAYLARWPEVAQAAKNIAAQKDSWIRDAYAARDAYASAAQAYRVAAGTSAAVDAKRAALDGAIAVLANIVTQVISYQNAHKS